jgi:hypothetical protein
MSASPSRIRSTPGQAIPNVPVAGPPQLPPRLVPEESAAAEPWWTPESLKGWGASVAMHVVILVLLGLWYFVPDPNPPLAFDTRLAGSPNGVPDGDELTGGLNTPLDMPPAPLSSDEIPIIAAPLEQLDLKPLEPEAIAQRNRAASAGAGRLNNNPGAGDGDGFGLARFGQGGEMIKGKMVKVGDPQFTLIWNTDDVDLDLHVIDPDGREIFWENPKGLKEGEPDDDSKPNRLDVDNTKGYGPENVYWLVESDGPGSEKVKGYGPPGTYKWYVVFWSGFGGIPKPTHWQVRVKHAGKVTVHHGKFSRLNEHSKVYTLKVEPHDKAGAAP